MGPFGFSMTAVHCHNCLARAINTASLEKGKEKRKKRDERKVSAAPKGESSEMGILERILEIHSAIRRDPMRSRRS